MYRGFKINDIDISSEEYFAAGKTLTTSLNETVSVELNKLLSSDGIINGESLENEWFPQIRVDIFISHSHADERLAFALSGWLYHNFGLKTFVDSNIWGNADSLLKAIDEKFCKLPDSAQYDYNKRNQSTSFVHMMLAMAISKLIDKTECLFLLNTPNAVKPTNAVDEYKTHSPWLYFEAGISGLMRKPLSYFRSSSIIEKTKMYSKVLNEARDLKVELPLASKHFTDLGANDLVAWKKKIPDTLEGKVHPLDILYELFE